MVDDYSRVIGRLYLPYESRFYGIGRDSITILVMPLSITGKNYDGIILMDPRANPEVTKKMTGNFFGKIKQIKRDGSKRFVNLDDISLPELEGRNLLNLTNPFLPEEILVMTEERINFMLSKNPLDDLIGTEFYDEQYKLIF